METFGFPITRHPLEPYFHLLKGRVKKAKYIPKYVGKTIRLAGVYITRKVTQTRKRDPMEFLTLEDETDIYECVLFPESFNQYGDLLNWESLFLVRGKVEESFGVHTITIEKLESLSRLMGKDIEEIETGTIAEESKRQPVTSYQSPVSRFCITYCKTNTWVTD